MAAVAEAGAGEEPWLLGSVPRAEGEGEIHGAVGEEGPARGDNDDEEILRFMDSVDGYLLLMDSLSSTLRQGWLDLASARHSMGPSRVSSTLFDHKEQSAATKLQIVDHADFKPSESKPLFALSKWCFQEECQSSNDVPVHGSTKPKLRHRGSATTPDINDERDATSAESSTGANTGYVQRARSKALSVFGALVPPKLRTAQVSFETALELIVELANSRSNMLASFSQIRLSPTIPSYSFCNTSHFKLHSRNSTATVRNSTATVRNSAATVLLHGTIHPNAISGDSLKE